MTFYVVTRPGIRRTGIYLPDFFVAGLLMYAIGAAVIYIGGGYIGAHSVLLMAELALFSANLGVIIGLLLFERRYPNDYVQHSLVQWTLGCREEQVIYWGLIVSAGFCAIFSISVLRNNEISSLLADMFRISENHISSLLEARKTITNATEGYFAPGFVKEFRDILIPIFLAAIILIATRQPLTLRQKLVVLIAGVSALVAMALAGIRSNLFLFFIALYVARVLAQRVYGKKRRSRRQLFFVVIAIAVYGLLTVLLGRVNADGSYSSLTLEVLGNLFDRILMSAPRENIMSYPFWVDLSPALGKYWIMDLGGILPGAGNVGLSNLLHQYNGGSIEGNSSLGLAVDVWINWSWVGLLIFPMLYGLFIVYFDCMLANARSPIAFGVKVVLALALMKIYTPFGFVLYGGAVSILLYVGLNLLRKREGIPGKVLIYQCYRSA